MQQKHLRGRYTEETQGMTRQEKVRFYSRKRWEEIKADPKELARFNEDSRKRMRAFHARARAAEQDSDPTRLRWRKYWVTKTRSQALWRGVEFTVTADDLQWPDRGICPVFGFEMCVSRFPSGARGILTAGEWLELKDAMPSVDRIDNTKGYVPGNVVIVSGLANRLKSNATAAQLRALADFYAELERRAELGI